MSTGDTINATVTINGVPHRFEASGPGPTVVALFRAWLDSPACATDVATGADDVEAASLAATVRELDAACAEIVPAVPLPAPIFAGDEERLVQRVADDVLRRIFAPESNTPQSFLTIALAVGRMRPGITMVTLKRAIARLEHEGRIRAVTLPGRVGPHVPRQWVATGGRS